MERHLQETYGIMVYQEQVMRLAADLAGFSLGEADTLRKAMGKKDRELMATSSARSSSRAARPTRSTRRKAERIWDLIEKFAGYGFNKSHAACYGARRVPDGVPQGELPGRVHGRPAHLGNGEDGQDRPVHGGEPRHGPARGAARRQRLPLRVHAWRARRSTSGSAAIKNVGATAIESIVRTARGRTAASPRSTTSARASTCAWSTGAWSRA